MAETGKNTAAAQTNLLRPTPDSLKRRVPRSFPFKYYIHDSVAACRLQLFGECTEEDVADLQGCWTTVKTSLGDRKLILDVCGLQGADDAAKRWLLEMAAEGAVFRPETYLRDGLSGQECTKRKRPRARLFSRVIAIFRGSPVQA